MSQKQTLGLNEVYNLERIIGQIEGESLGPTLIFVGGLHGNEHSGVIAIQKVLSRLANRRKFIKGNIYGLSGNIRALQSNVRFIDKDLNRIWNSDHETNGYPSPYESIEKVEILSVLEKIINSTNELIYLFDLHSTSSNSIPFLVVADTIRNRKIAKKIPVPVILGLEEKMDGTLFSFLSSIGFSTLIFEAGQHDDPMSIRNHEAFIWLMLSKMGILDKQFKYEVESYRKKLQANSGNKTHHFEVRHRYHIHNGESFSMNPGFSNFQKIKKGQKLAKSENIDIEAVESGKILMPRYQAQGEDGFLIVRRVNKIWIFISWILRLSRMDVLLSALPGIKRGDVSNTFVINRKITKIYPMQIFHLLGFKQVDKYDNVLVVSKRDFDIHSPTPQQIRQRFLAKR